ncbi:MAG: hypothetical protein KC468_38245 [Myxococcales bacterium]|nr:hypothetical protein [Myxococcales bacterium]
MSVQGKTICLIGEFDSQPRDELEFGLYDIGADVVKRVSKKVDFVIAGRDPGARADEARALGIPILGEADLDALFRGVSPDELIARAT